VCSPLRLPSSSTIADACARQLEASPSDRSRSRRPQAGMGRLLPQLHMKSRAEKPLPVVNRRRATSVGSRLPTDVASEKSSRRERQVTDLEPAIRLPSDSGRSSARAVIDGTLCGRPVWILYRPSGGQARRTAASIVSLRPVPTPSRRSAFSKPASQPGPDSANWTAPKRPLATATYRPGAVIANVEK
jgi:hypothetical protein